MKTVFWILGTVILTIVLSGLAGFVLWPIPVVTFLYFRSQNVLKVYGAGFGLGIVQDLVTGFPLGFSSLILSFFALTLFIVGNRFRIDLKGALALGVLFEIIYILLFNFLSF